MGGRAGVRAGAGLSGQTPRRDVARRGLTEPEAQDWAVYVSRVVPLPGRTRPTVTIRPEEPARPVAAPAPVVVAPVRPASRGAYLEIGRQPAGVDNATWRRLRTGRVPVNRSLDLHGFTAQRAFHALESWLRHAQMERARCVEVITGRGAGEGGGILWRELPLWLNLPQLRPMVLAAAHPHAANTGATRILLRKPGPKSES